MGEPRRGTRRLSLDVFLQPVSRFGFAYRLLRHLQGRFLVPLPEAVASLPLWQAHRFRIVPPPPPEVVGGRRVGPHHHLTK